MALNIKKKNLLKTNRTGIGFLVNNITLIVTSLIFLTNQITIP